MSLPSLLEGEGVVVLAGLAVPHQVAGLLTQPEKRLSICPTDRSMVPAAGRGDSGGLERDGKNKQNTTQHRKSNDKGQTSLANTKQKHETKGQNGGSEFIKKNIAVITKQQQELTHNWLSRGMVGSMRSPREELQWSSDVILVLTRQPLECRCRGRVFPSFVGDIRDFSTPSN